MTFITSQGRKVETLELNGKCTPFRNGDYVVLRLAVDGIPCPAWQIPAADWEREAATTRESEFWQNWADGSLTMRDTQSVL